MRKIYSLTVVLALLVSCSNSNNIKPAKEGPTRIIAVYIKPDSTKFLDILLRQIVKTVKYDSSEKKDIVVVDTLWGYPTLVALRDSSNKIIKDSLGNIKYSKNIYYTLISKDSVNYKIENISFDSLIKK